MTVKVAVLVRTKNRPLLLQRALASISAQTTDERVVTVVVNDGGEPAEVDRLVAASGVADSAVVVHHEESRGRSAALNAGLAASEAECFAIHDDDDSWHPDFLARTLAYLDATPAAASVAARTEVVHEEIDGDVVRETGREVLARDWSEVTLAQTAWQNYVPPIAMVVRTAVVDTIGTFDPELPVLEDWDFNLRLLAHAPMGFVDGEPLAFWHQRPSVSGDLGNSVVGESSDHDAYDHRIRDSYLRRDLAGEGTGLGAYLATARLLRNMAADADHHATTLHDHVEGVAGPLHEHLELMAGTLSVEIGRLRGELLAMREVVDRIGPDLDRSVKDSRRQLRQQLRADLKPVRQGLRRMARRVDDLWQTDKGVARLVRGRRRTGG